MVNTGQFRGVTGIRVVKRGSLRWLLGWLKGGSSGWLLGWLKRGSLRPRVTSCS